VTDVHEATIKIKRESGLHYYLKTTKPAPMRNTSSTIFRNKRAKGRQRDAKNFWSSLSEQTREKKY